MIWLLDFIPNFLIHSLLALGIFTYIASKFSPIYTVELRLVTVLLLVVSLFFEGALTVHDAMQEQVKVQKLEIEQLKNRKAEASIQTITKYVDRVRVIEKKGDNIIKYVDRYITEKDNTDCKLPDSFRLLHNSGATNSEPSGTANESTSGNP